MLLNGSKVELSNINLTVISEDTDFSNEFKFAKNNLLKQLIYNDVIEKINEQKIIQYSNEIYDIIDNKINKLLDRKINKNGCNLKLEIEIPNIYAIIDKFTNIYIDDKLLNSKEVSKSMKRKLLYKLYFWDIKNKKDKTNIVIIENFDAYLNSNEIIEFMNTITDLSKKDCHFILTTSSNILEYINIDIFSVYKIGNKIYSLDILNTAIKDFLLYREYKNSKEEDFDTFCDNNEHLISNEEIIKIKNELFEDDICLISKILNSNEIRVVNTKPKNVYSDYIICKDKEKIALFEEICKNYID